MLVTKDEVYKRWRDYFNPLSTVPVQIWPPVTVLHVNLYGLPSPSLICMGKHAIWVFINAFWHNQL